MNSEKKVSIAVVTNPLSVLLANTILFDYHKADETILVIDYGKKKESLLNELYNCASKKNWSKIICLGSKTSDESDSRPGFTKRLSRKYKNNPILKPVYNVLQRRVQKKIEQKIEVELCSHLEKFKSDYSVNLFLLTQTYANVPLKKMFSKAQINYFEHGIGDYTLSIEINESAGTKFWGLFATEYAEFSKSINIEFIPIDFYGNRQTPVSTTQRNKVLILLQNLEIYTLGLSFWEDYFTDILKNSGTHVTYLIKPHPLQSNEILAFCNQFFGEKQVKFEILPFVNSIEIEFENHTHEIRAVYSPFSSSLYYLKKIYGTGSIQFYQSTNRIKKLIGNAPAQFKNRFLANQSLIRDVFGKNCTEF